MGCTLLTKTFFCPLSVPTIEWLASPPCWLWWFSFKQNGYLLSRQSFEKKKWARGWEIKLTSRGMFTRGKYRRERSHSGAFVSLVQSGSAAHMYWGRWLNMRYWSETRKKKKKTQGKANNWIWLSLNVSVCSAMWLCLHSWNVCPGSSQQGAGFGTAGHIYSTSPQKNHWTPTSPCLSSFQKQSQKRLAGEKT